MASPQEAVTYRAADQSSAREMIDWYCTVLGAENSLRGRAHLVYQL